MKCYQPDEYFANENENKNKEEFVEVITLSLTRGAVFPVSTAGVICNALIYTSATRSYISETFYNQLIMAAKDFHLVVMSASGSTLCPMGIVQCSFQLRGHCFEFNFIVCQNLTRSIILGLDFMHKHQIALTWSNTGKGLLTLKNKLLVETLDICKMGPQLMTCSNLPLPPRTLAVINVHVDLKVNSAEHTYDVKPNSLLMDWYPNIVVVPVIHIMPKQTETIIPFIVINLSTESIFLSKCEALACLEPIDT